MPTESRFLSSGPSLWIVEFACFVALLKMASVSAPGTHHPDSLKGYAIAIMIVACSIPVSWLVFQAQRALPRHCRSEATPPEEEVRIVRDDEI